MAIVKEDLAAVSPDALAPAATEAKAENIGVTKAAMPRCQVLRLRHARRRLHRLRRHVLLHLPRRHHHGLRRAAPRRRLVLLPGLCLVLCCGAELFTGNVLMVCAKASKKITFGGLFRNWGIVWVGNLAGSLLAMFIIFMSNLQGMNGGAVGEAFVSVAAGKVSLAPEVLFFKAILCNILVCLAVWIGFSSKTTADKVLGILLPISAFVACGFEHCVANMFFLPMGLVLNGLGFGAAGAVTLGGVAYNLVLATLGNIVGGLLVGLAYWFIYRKKQEK